MRRIGTAVVMAALAVAGAGRVAAAQTTYAGALSGAQQVPANGSTASGFSTLTLNGNLLTVNVSWAGLTGGPLAAGHIHCCAAPVNAGVNAGVAVPFVGIGSTVSGSYVNTFDLLNAATYLPAFLAENGNSAATARATLVAGLNANQAYVNLHNAVYPNGEIRANVSAVPEPSTFALAAAGVGGAGLVARRRRRA